LRSLHADAGDWGAWARVTELYVPRAVDAASRAALLEELAEVLESRAAHPAGAWNAWRRAFQERPSSERALAALERLAPDHGDPAELVSSLEQAAEAATGERRAGLLLRVAVARGVRGGDPDAGAEAVRRAVETDPGCLDGLASGNDSIPAGERARLLAWGAAAFDEQGEAGRALGLLEAAHRLDPDAAGVAVALERCYREGGNAERLADLLRIRASVAAEPEVRVRTLLALGEVLDGTLDRPAEAEAALREALSLGVAPEAAAGLHLRLARMRSQDSGDPAAAQADYEQVLAHEPGNLVAIRALADIRTRAGDRAGFAKMLVAEARHVDDPARAASALVEAARILELLGRPREETSSLHEEALARVPDHLPAALALSEALEARGDFAGVARLLEGAVPRLADGDPGELHRHLCRGLAREHAGDASGALDAYRQARKLDPRSLSALKGMAGILGPRGDAQEALPVLEAILDHHRDALTPAELAVTSGWVGQLLERKGETARAAGSYERALEADPLHVPSLQGMARTLLAREDWPRAAGALERLLAIPEVQADHAGAARLHLQLGELLRDRVGDEELALHHFELALDSDSRLVKAFAAIEQLLAGRRRWRDLARAIERMIARLPESPDTEKARTALWKELGALQQRALGDLPAARSAYERVVRASPDDLDALQSFAELAAGVPGQEAAAADALRSIAIRQKDPSRTVSKLLAVQLARKDLDRAYAAADVLAHLLRSAGPDELETVDRLRRLAREFATRSLDDVLWQRLLHERLRGGPVAGILSLLSREAGSLFVQAPKDLGLNPARDEVPLATSGLVLANGIKYTARSLGIEGVRLFRVVGSPMRLGFANTDPPSLVAGEETYQDRPRRELWYVAARAVSFYRPELRLARLMPHDQLQAVFQAACCVGAPSFVPTADPRTVQKIRGPIERIMEERGKLPALARLAEEYAAGARPGDVRAHMDAVELTSNRAGALLAGDLQVARRLVLEEKAQVSKLQDEAKVRDLVQFCLSE
ncbi:MAG: Tetratricopeptide 2 repeat protein, partial [Anaeromyxobacteraceae bacterium]|nr:Tetratricopeptide 2 repeat protein [Anaeromyxobacteraceae bacterium]